MNENELKVLKEKVIDGMKSLALCRQEDVESGGISMCIPLTQKELVLILDMIEREEMGKNDTDDGK